MNLDNYSSISGTWLPNPDKLARLLWHQLEENPKGCTAAQVRVGHEAGNLAAQLSSSSGSVRVVWYFLGVTIVGGMWLSLGNLPGGGTYRWQA